MPTPHPPPLMIPDYVAPVIAAGVFILLMGFVREPARRTVNALIVAGASGAYLSGGGFGVWEIALPVVAMTFAYAGLRSYRSIAIAWFMHAGWDFLHHMWDGPIWPFMPTSSFGCLILKTRIGMLKRSSSGPGQNSFVSTSARRKRIAKSRTGYEPM